VTERLRTYLAERERDLQERTVRWGQELEANEVLGRRDYAFCLYPESSLRPFCTQFL
jgi:hypothetical protein